MKSPQAEHDMQGLSTIAVTLLTIPCTLTTIGKMETREDMPRVSVDSVQDWNDIRTRYREAALESIEAQIAANQSLARERDAMITNMDDVGAILLWISD